MRYAESTVLNIELIPWNNSHISYHYDEAHQKKYVISFVLCLNYSLQPRRILEIVSSPDSLSRLPVDTLLSKRITFDYNMEINDTKFLGEYTIV